MWGAFSKVANAAAKGADLASKAMDVLDHHVADTSDAADTDGGLEEMLQLIMDGQQRTADALTQLQEAEAEGGDLHDHFALLNHCGACMVLL